MRPFLQELAPRKESLTMENVFAPQAQQTLNGYISRTKHRRRGVQRLSNVLRSSPSFKTIPSSIGSEFALGCSRNGQTERETERQTDRVTFSLTMSKAPRPSAAGQKNANRILISLHVLKRRAKLVTSLRLSSIQA